MSTLEERIQQQRDLLADAVANVAMYRSHLNDAMKHRDSIEDNLRVLEHQKQALSPGNALVVPAAFDIYPPYTPFASVDGKVLMYQSPNGFWWTTNRQSSDRSLVDLLDLHPQGFQPLVDNLLSTGSYDTDDLDNLPEGSYLKVSGSSYLLAIKLGDGTWSTTITRVPFTSHTLVEMMYGQYSLLHPVAEGA